MKRTLTHLTLASTLAVFSVAGHAGTFFESEGVAIKGFDPVAYFTVHKAIKGTPAHTAVYKGSTFRFASAANRDSFVANPSRYAPQYDGYCAFGVAKGAKAKTEGEAFKIVAGKLYLNYDKTIQSDWQKQQAQFIATADKKWSDVRQLTSVVQ